MSSSVATKPSRRPASPPGRQERSMISRILSRPEVGALAAAIAIFIFFYAVAPPFRTLPALATVLYASSTIGIVAVGVALLMIGGEFDLSAGVMVTTAALASAMICYQLSLNMWVGVVVSLLIALAIGFVNGYLVVRTGIPSFLITLSTFFILQGLNLGVTKMVTGTVATPNTSGLDGFSQANAIFASINLGFMTLKVTVLWWFFFVAVASWLLRTRRATGSPLGGNQASARAVSVPVRKVKIGLFMGVAFLAWFLGMHLLFNFSTVQKWPRRRQRVHHRRGRRRRPAHRWLQRLGRRLGARCLHLRHDNPGHRVRRLGPELVPGLPGRHVAARRDGQPVHQELRRPEEMTFVTELARSCRGCSTAVGHGSDERQRGGHVTGLITEHAAADLKKGTPLVEMEGVGKSYGAINALEGINLRVNGEVACPRGQRRREVDPHQDHLGPAGGGTLKVDGKERHFSSPRESLDSGIATVYQDLAVVPLMEVWRNFFSARRSTRQVPDGPLDIKAMQGETADAELQKWASSSRTSTAHRDAVGWSAAVRRHRPRRVLRCPGAHPRRADRRAGCPSSQVWC